MGENKERNNIEERTRIMGRNGNSYSVDPDVDGFSVFELEGGDKDARGRRNVRNAPIGLQKRTEGAAVR